MASITLDPSLNQINRKFENMKVDVQKRAPAVNEFSAARDQQLYHNYVVNESLQSNANVVSPDIIGDGVASFAPEDFSELAVITDSNGFIAPAPGIYTGTHTGVLSAQGYMQYPMDGMQYYNPVVEYNYSAQPLYGTMAVSTGLPYPPQNSDGYVYGPQLYQYHMQPYYQHGQYVTAAPTIPGGGMLVYDSQDQTAVMPNVYNNYAGPIAPVNPVALAPPFENGVVPVSVSYPSQFTYQHHMLRASAPAWIETPAELKAPTELKNSAKDMKSEVSGTHHFCSSDRQKHMPVPGSTLLNGSLHPTAKDTGALACSALSTDAKASYDIKHIKKDANNQNSEAKSAVDSPSVHVNSPQSKNSHPLPKVPAVIANKDVDTHLNSELFAGKFEDAKFYIIKSYSEENVYRSIQYGVWASTPNGNKKLDEAYHDAQKRASGKPCGCPVFLFFSVNGSRQFCGVAEMIGPVDYRRTMEFWEQHKWSGSFPVKWHFIKDVPNSLFRRVILQNNENKPVTNSRDTQEVYLAQGLEMLNIIKTYPSKSSILDEFGNVLGQQVLAKTFSDSRPVPHSLSHQAFPKINEQISRTQVANLADLKTSNFAALKACENGPKSTKEVVSIAAKSMVTKLPPAVAGSESRRLDKENIKFVAKDGIIAAA